MTRTFTSDRNNSRHTWPGNRFRSPPQAPRHTTLHARSGLIQSLPLGAWTFLFGLSLFACSTPDVTDSPTPTASPTATPTPVPFTGPTYQVTDVKVLPDGTGLDLNADGSVDSGLKVNLDEISARLSAEVLLFCQTNDCSAEAQVMAVFLTSTLEVLMTPEGLEQALKFPLNQSEEYVYFQLNTAEPAWRMRWYRTPVAGDLDFGWVEGQELSNEPLPHTLWLQATLPAHLLIPSPDDSQSDFSLTWDWAPTDALTQWPSGAETSSTPTLRMGGKVGKAELQSVFQELKDGCIDCITDPCPDPCAWLYEKMGEVSEAVLAEDLDGDLDPHSFGMALDVTGERLP